MVILGLHFGHDAGIAVLKNGKAICNLIRERYNRAKHSFGINVSHIEKALLDAKIKVEDIDMIAVTSSQGYELVVVDRPKELEFQYGEHPKKKFKSTLYTKDFDVNDNSFKKHLCGDMIDNVYSKNNIQYKN